MTGDELPDDNPAERAQAARLREQARTGGLRFEAYLPKDQADWLLAQIERGRFADPSEAVFLIVQNFIEMEPHRDLHDELLRRMLERSLEDVKAGRVHDAAEVFDELRRELARPRPEPARWEKIAR